MSTLSIEERFWSRVDKTTDAVCWPWRGRLSRSGYGYFSRRGIGERAHRVAWELHHGRHVPRGLVVMHVCDNPGCVNPAHLRAGTQLENMADCKSKGRFNRLRGEKNGHTKLTEQQVREMFAMRESGAKLQTIATRMSFSLSGVSAILNGKLWAHLGLAKREAA